MQGKVPVGVTSVAGYTVTLAAAVGAVLAFLKGDRSDQTLGVLASVGVAVLAFLSTQLGRYAQAHAAVKNAAVTKAPPVVTRVVGRAPAEAKQVGLVARVKRDQAVDPTVDRGSLSALIGDDPELDDPEHGAGGPAPLHRHTNLKG